MNQYLQVHCDKFALLVETGVIEEVISMDDINLDDIRWREMSLPYIDLTELLSGETSKNNRDCLIFKGQESGVEQQYYAIAVGGVSNIESIKEQDFAEIPCLDFNYNQYFDKAYIHPESRQCIYRLKRDAFEVTS